jgi:hypothetical protein
MIPGAGVDHEDKLYVFVFNYYGLAIILSLSTPVRGNFLPSISNLLLFKGHERTENDKKRGKT